MYFLFRKYFLPALPLVAALMPAASSAYQAEALARLLQTGVCAKCDLSNAPLAGRNLARSQLPGARLRGADLTGANLSHANLEGADLTNALLDKTDLSASVLREAILVGTRLSNARLVGADLRNADLTHLEIDRDLEFIDIVGVLFEGARFKHGERCAGFPEKGGFGCAAQPRR